MRRYKYKNRTEYFKAQIERSQLKFSLCKVYFSDIIRYRNIISLDQKKVGKENNINSILCLGVRSGAEIDMFRAVFYSPFMHLGLISKLASSMDQTKMADQKKRIAKWLGPGAGSSKDGRILGVEINPEAARSDILIGSFDQLPKDWSGKFDLLYTNSFDHSLNPEETIKEWKRVTAPGGYIIVAYAPNTPATLTDPIGGLTMAHLLDLWQSPVVYASDTLSSSPSSEICFRVD